MLHVAGKPILAHILDELTSIGVDEAVLVVGHLGEWMRRMPGSIMDGRSALTVGLLTSKHGVYLPHERIR